MSSIDVLNIQFYCDIIYDDDIVIIKLSLLFFFFYYFFFFFSFFFFSSRRRHTRSKRDWSSDVCSSDLDFRKTYRTARTAGGYFMGYSAAVLAVLYVLRKSRYKQFSPVEDSYEHTEGDPFRPGWCPHRHLRIPLSSLETPG